MKSFYLEQVRSNYCSRSVYNTKWGLLSSIWAINKLFLIQPGANDTRFDPQDWMYDYVSYNMTMVTSRSGQLKCQILVLLAQSRGRLSDMYGQNTPPATQLDSLQRLDLTPERHCEHGHYSRVMTAACSYIFNLECRWKELKKKETEMDAILAFCRCL